MNILNLFESPKLGAPSNRPGAQDIGDQHSPSPIGSGTSKREAKKKPVTMMGVPVKEERIVEVWEPITESLRDGEYVTFEVFFDDGTSETLNFNSDDIDWDRVGARRNKQVVNVKRVGGIQGEPSSAPAKPHQWPDDSFARAQRAYDKQIPEGVAEAGPFSYGTKKPRKGSVADLAAKKRQEQERGKQPAEPRDQMVGVARVVKDVAEGFLGDRTFNRVMPMVKRIAGEVSDYDRDEFGEELWSLLDQKYGPKFAQSVLQDELDFYWNEYTELTGQDVAEGSIYKKDQDLSSIPTQELEAFVRKHWGGGVPTYGQGESVKRAMRELRRRQKQGVAEGNPVNVNALMSKADRAGRGAPWWARAGDLNYMGDVKGDKELQLKVYFPDMFNSWYFRHTLQGNKEELLKQAKALGMEQDDEGLWFYPVYRLTSATKHEITKAKYMFGDKVKRVKPEQDMAEGSVQDKLHQRHQELRKKSGLPDPNYYKELKATYDLPDAERYAKAAELKKKYNVKEGILDRSPAKLPKPRNPAERVLRTKVNAAGQHTNKKRQQQLQPKHRGRDELDEGWKSAVAGAALAGAAALGGGAAQAGDLEKSIGPLPVMATIVIQMPDGQTKTIKKDLGHSYDYKLDDAKKDIQNLLDKKGIKQYTIHLDRYNSNDAYLDRDAMKGQGKDYSAKSNYIDSSPYQGKDTKTDYMDKAPYKAKPTTVNYVDRAKSGEFRDMANYEESIEEMDRRGFLKAMGGAALAGAGVDAAAQQMDTMARVVMMVNGERVERVINLGQVSSPQAAERALANELRARGIEQFQINLERGAPPKTEPVNTRPGPYGARSISGPGGVVDTAGQVAGDIQDGDWRSAVKKGYKTYQNNKNADMGAIGRAEVKDRIVRGVVGGLGLDEDLTEDIDSHLYLLTAAGYDIVTEAATLCPECGGTAYGNKVLAEKQDACYHKVKSRYKVWPSAYASGALVRCRKKGAKNWGNKSKK